MSKKLKLNQARARQVVWARLAITAETDTDSLGDWQRTESEDFGNPEAESIALLNAACHDIADIIRARFLRGAK